MWKIRNVVREYVTLIRVKIVLTLVISFYVSQSFGTIPDAETQLFYMRTHASNILQQIKKTPTFLAKKPEYTISPTPPSSGFTFGLPKLPNVTSSPTASLPVYPTQGVLPTQTNIQPTSPPQEQIPTAIPQATNTAIPTQPLPPAVTCPSTSTESYDSLSIEGSPTANANNHGDINLRLRGYTQIDEAKELQSFSQNYDSKRPQLKTFFSPAKGPDFYQTYRVYNWNFSANTRGSIIENPPVTLIGLRANPGESVVVPAAGYTIGSGKQVLVLYADSTRITLKYTREDNVVYGYTIHIEDFCTDPNLVSLYNEKHAAGRGSLPALSSGEKIGVARTGELKIVIRDTGSFMDPRMRDWW